MVDRASLQLIGFVLASVTACVILVAATLVYRSADLQLADRLSPWQAEQTVAFHRI